MPSGAAVVEYRGRRGTVFRVKFRDASGVQVMQTLGRASDGWTRQRAERELGKLLDKVERERWRKPTRERVSALVDEFLDEYLPSRGRRRSTVLDYANTLRNHVLPTLGDVELAGLEARPELLDRYIAAKRRQNLAPKTIANHLRTLSAMFEYARRRRRMTLNPVGLLEPLSVPTPDTPVLREEEVAALLNAYRVEEDASDPPERLWWALARRVTAFALGTGASSRRDPRVALGGRRDARAAPPRPPARSFAASSASRRARRADGRSRTGPGPRTCSPSSSEKASTGRPTRSSSLTPSSGRRSTRRS